MAAFEKIVLVTKKTALEELIERFNSAEQARFYLEHAGISFDEYSAAHQTYYGSVDTLRRNLPAGTRWQVIERSFLPTFTFGQNDLVLTAGPDGLVVNTAKYLTSQPLLAVNPDPARFDGVLVPFQVASALRSLPSIVAAGCRTRAITMAKAEMNDGQSLLAVNDLFIGARSHVSARYQISHGVLGESQSSSGIIVSTGAGSTGWFRSILTGAAAIAGAFVPEADVAALQTDYAFPPESDYLYYSVREPFISRVSGATLVFGKLGAGEKLEIVSQMPQNGVIFSDGVEADYLAFNSGSRATISVADRKLLLAQPH